MEKTMVADVARLAVIKRSGSSTKGGTSNMRYFVAKICKYAPYESSEGLFCSRRKSANPWHPRENGLNHLGSDKALLLASAW